MQDTNRSPVRIGVVGCGNIARRMHVPAWNDLDGVEVVAVADPDPTARESMRESLGLDPTDAFSDPLDLIARSDVDAVDVCTPQSFRRDVLVQACRAHKHVLVEKPIATTPADAFAAVSEADKQGVLLAIVHNYLALPEVVVAREAIEAGGIGAVRSVIVNMLGVVYEPGAAGDWRRDLGLAGGGVLMDILHAVYLAESLCGDVIQRVSAYVGSDDPTSTVEDLALVRLETDGPVALVNTGWGFGPGGIHITGRTGRIDIRYESGSTPPWANLEHVTMTTSAGTTQLMGPATETRVGLGDFPSHRVAFRSVAQRFIDAVRDRDSEPLATGADGLRSLEATLAAYQSAATGETVPLPLDHDSPVFNRGARGIRSLPAAPWAPLEGSALFDAPEPADGV